MKWVFLSFLILLSFQCKEKKAVSNTSLELKLSLAQWSIHRALEKGDLKASDFASIAKNDFGITAIEYVSSFYTNVATDRSFWKEMRKKADSLTVKSLLIMVDNEGDLGNPLEQDRMKAVENHFKWVDVASILGCHSIRVNAFGEGTKEETKEAMIDALKKLCEYASQKKINVLIENHGLYSSDGQWIASIMKGVNRTNCGTLPDFGNWCITAKWGSTEPSKSCEKMYDRYTGVEEMLPFAKGVSAKSYLFDQAGEETIIDYGRMISIVKKNSFDGYIGVEYEGTELSEEDGIKATKALVERKWKEIQ